MVMVSLWVMGTGVAEMCGPDPHRVCIIPAVCVVCHPMCKSCYNACNKCFCCDRCIECCPVPAVLPTIRSERWTRLPGRKIVWKAHFNFPSTGKDGPWCINCLPVHTDHVTDLITATCIYDTPEIWMKCCNIQVIDLCLMSKDVVEVV